MLHLSGTVHTSHPVDESPRGKLYTLLAATDHDKIRNVATSPVITLFLYYSIYEFF